MNREQIDELLNPENDKRIKFNIDAAINHIKSKTNCDFHDEYGELDLPIDLVKAVELLIKSIDTPNNVQSESVGGELSTTYFDKSATESIKEYWLPYRKVAW